MSTSTAIRATPGLEEKGLLEVIERGEGRTASRYRLNLRGVNLTAQGVADGRCRCNLTPQQCPACGVNLTGQADGAPLSLQSDTTSGGAGGGNLTPQSGLSLQSDTTTNAPVKGTRAGAHARVGGWERTTPPTTPPTGADRASAHAEPLDPGAVDLMAALDLKRVPRIAEQHEISGLYTAKIAAGFTDAEIRNSVGGEWEGAKDRVRTLLWRFKQMPDQPIRRPTAQRPAPKPQWECVACKDPVTGPVTAAARCPGCWSGAAEHAKGQLAALDRPFADALLDETRKHLEANGWRPEGAVVTILAAELMRAHDAPARAAQVLGKWDRQRAEAERQTRGAA